MGFNRRPAAARHTGPVIKTIGFVVLWLAGSAAAVAVAWAGVSVVDDELIDPAPANSLSAARSDLATEAAASPATGIREPASAASPTSEPTTTTTVTSTSTTVEPGSTTGAAGGAGPTPGQQVTPASPEPGPTPAAQPAAPPPAPATPSPRAATPPAPTPTAPPAPAQAQTRTFDLVGGTTAISFSSSATKVLWATPNPGFEVSIQPESPGFKVEFRADHHRSRIDVWWSGGPQFDIREEPDDN